LRGDPWGDVQNLGMADSKKQERREMKRVFYKSMSKEK